MIEQNRTSEDTTFQSVDEDDSIIKIKNSDSEKWAKIYYLFKDISSLQKNAQFISSNLKNYQSSCATLNDKISNLIGDLKNDGQEQRRKRSA